MLKELNEQLIFFFFFLEKEHKNQMKGEEK